MADVVHHEGGDSGSSMGYVMGAILLIVALFLIIYFLLPGFRGTGTGFNAPSGPGSVNINPR